VSTFRDESLSKATLPGEERASSFFLDGERRQPESALRNEVLQAAHAEWRAMLVQRSRQRRICVYGLAASIAAAVLIVAATFQWIAANRGAIATIARIEGSLQRSALNSDNATSRRVGQQVSAGETLRTDERAVSDHVETNTDHSIGIDFATSMHLKPAAQTH
jgi:hypothetical protein